MKKRDHSRENTLRRRYSLGAKIFIGGIYFSIVFLVVLIIYMMKNPY